MHPHVIKMLLLRGIATEKALWSFFYPSADHLENPLLLAGMKAAVERAARAVKNGEPIAVYGDYDADGITSTSILKKALDRIGANAFCKIPLRSEGYGITPAAVDRIAEETGASLIITVDNGSTAHEAMARAKARGIDVVVTDHHEILGGKHPDCFAFVNPKRADCGYPFKFLCGAGVAFKFVQALLEAFGLPWKKHMWDFVELASLGTIADVMPLVGENRAICSLGMKKMNFEPSLAFESLFELANLPNGRIDGGALAFKIAPVFNAAGRVGDPNFAVKLFSDPDFRRCDLQELLRMNEYRKLLTAEQLESAEAQIAAKSLQGKSVIVVWGDFHEGIIGILAGRISDKHKKPSIVISSSGKGSARGGPDESFSIVAAVEKCAPLLKTFGGHQGAAGLSIDLKNIEAFEREIQVHGPRLREQPSFLRYDGVVSLQSFPLSLLDDLKMLEPFGHANPKPIFRSPDTKLKNVEIFGKKGKHVKFLVNGIEAVAFSKGDGFPLSERHSPVDLLYTPSYDKSFIVHDFSLKTPS